MVVIVDTPPESVDEVVRKEAATKFDFNSSNEVVVVDATPILSEVDAVLIVPLCSWLLIAILLVVVVVVDIPLEQVVLVVVVVPNELELRNKFLTRLAVVVVVVTAGMTPKKVASADVLVVPINPLQ